MSAVVPGWTSGARVMWMVQRGAPIYGVPPARRTQSLGVAVVRVSRSTVFALDPPPGTTEDVRVNVKKFLGVRVSKKGAFYRVQGWVRHCCGSSPAHRKPEGRIEGGKVVLYRVTWAEMPPDPCSPRDRRTWLRQAAHQTMGWCTSLGGDVLDAREKP